MAGENLWKIQVVRSNRKTIALQIDERQIITVRAPFRMADEEVRRFVEERSGWIEKHLQIMERRAKEQESQGLTKLTPEEIRRLADRAVEYIPGRVALYAPRVHVDYGRITIRNQRSRWGSCSAKGNLNFNCLLMLAPPEVIDYVVVHELCHRLEMNHSVEFWKQVERVMPDYKKHRLWLKENGPAMMQRMVG
ncbi:MAG: M48 family metallopeptidase [Roseburia sp.]|nr:M48 family metallopeptidase [Roseburia sp.]